MEKNKKDFSAVDIINKVLKKIDEEQEYKKTEKKINKVSIYDTEIFKAYKRSKRNRQKDLIDTLNRFNPEKTLRVFIVLVFIFAIAFSVVTINLNRVERDRFSTQSSRQDVLISNKQQIVMDSLNNIKDADNKHFLLKPDNLNLAYVYDDIELDDEISDKLPRPVSVVDIPYEKSVMDSVVGQVFSDLLNKYKEIKNSIFNLSNIKPIILVRGYKLSERAILGSYNPEDSSHKLGKESTYFVSNFSNVKIRYLNGDMEEIEEYSHIKDIISMASVYTYYHNPYDVNVFVKYCNELFDSSIQIIPKTGQLYYCSDCMSYEFADTIKSVEIEKRSANSITHLNKLPDEQLLKIAHTKKTGIINRMNTDELVVKDSSYESYLDELSNTSQLDKGYNYCPGHIDLEVDVITLTLDETKGLVDVENIGNRGYNWTTNWHGWDLSKKALALALSKQDWEAEYGISISYVNFLQPLTKLEIKYYLDRLPADLSKKRYKVIETALSSVGLIPYYYGGKARKKGIKSNEFGTRVKPDYKGRVLKGLDCSGWVNWVYWTAIDDKTNGTSTIQLAKAGKKIRRSELIPGDIIVRPGYDSHVMMFYEWASDGRMKVIHENGTVNNVSVATVDGYYPYYRKILD